MCVRSEVFVRKEYEDLAIVVFNVDNLYLRNAATVLWAT